MNILKEKLDTRHGHYHGSLIGTAMAALMKRALHEGYDGYELEWWDVREGWVKTSCEFANSALRTGD